MADARGRSAPATERLFAALVLLLPLVFYVWHGKSYLGWGDETQFVDPAASALFGQGFTSGAWPYQRSSEFFAGNAPGYSLLLVPWLTAVGFGLEAARWFNVALQLAAGLLLWQGLRLAAPGMALWARALAVGTAFMGVGVLLSAGSARYDMFGLLAGAVAFLAMVHADRAPAGGRSWRHSASLLVSGAALFYAGFHLVAGSVVVLALLVRQRRSRFQWPALQLAIGLAIGMASWLVVMAWHGLFAKFFLMLFGSQHLVTGQVAKAVTQGGGRLQEKLNSFGTLWTLDASLSIVGAFLALLVVRQWSRSRAASAPVPTVTGAGAATRPVASDALLGWLAVDFVLFMPLVLLLIGKFPIYYTWMAYVPGLLIAAVWADRCRQRGERWPIVGFVLAAVLAAGAGLNDRISKRDLPPSSPAYAEFQGWVRQQLIAADLVYADHEAYFAARGVARRVFVPTYAQTVLVPGIPEHASVSALVVQAAHRAEATKLIGGEWQEVARFDPAAVAGGLTSADPAATKLSYVVLRRRGATP